ncbi:MAG TPA: hypothetical protein VFX85_03100 [Solirubrobacterales bacterium]|nr:hypothetical protein [Solirubrobacterales bacterium]
MSSKQKRDAILAVALSALALSAAPANATYNPISAGATKLSLDKGFLSLLAANGVSLKATAPATLKANTVTFPAVSGRFDPVSGQGTVQHDGALVFKAAGRSIPIKALQLKTTQKASPLSAKVGGGQLKLITAKTLKVSRQGFGELVKASTLALTDKVAVRLNKKLRLKGVFKAGQPVGSSSTQALPATVALKEGGNATLALSSEFSAKLGSLFVAVNPIFPAERPSGGIFTLPIFDGKLAPDASSGTLETLGAVEGVQQNGGQVFLREPILDLEAKALTAEVEVQPSPPYAGKQGRVAVADLDLATATASSDPKALQVGLASTTLKLQSGLAGTLNEVFAKPLGKGEVFRGGEVIGTFSFAALGEG